MQNEQITSELDRLKSDIAGLRDDMASLLRVLKEAGVDLGRNAYSRTSERARDARARLREQAEQTGSIVGREVQERPLTSVLAAFGTGFVIGMLLDRRR